MDVWRRTLRGKHFAADIEYLFVDVEADIAIRLEIFDQRGSDAERSTPEIHKHIARLEPAGNEFGKDAMGLMQTLFLEARTD